jgi:hypothetical protein
VAEVLHVTGKPVFVSPEAPAGVQNAPAVTSLTTSFDGLGVGEAVVTSGVGDDSDATTVGVADAVGFATDTPLFQINLPLLLMQVYLIPDTTLEVFKGLHALPLLTAPNALVGVNKNDTVTSRAKVFFMP